MSNSTSASAPSSDNNSDPPPSSSPPPSSPPPSPPAESDSSPPPPPPEESDSPPPPPEESDSPTPSDKNSPPPPPSKDSSSKSPPSSSDKFFTPPPPSEGKTKSTSPALEPPPSNDNDDSSSPPKHRKSHSSNDDGNGSNELQLPIIIGVAAGVAIFVLIILISALVCCCKKKKKHKMHYYDPEEKGNNNYYNNGGGYPPKWQAQPTDHKVKIPQPPGNLGPGQGGGGGGWAAPPPPHGTMNSSDMSSSTTFSGPHGGGPPMPPPSPGLSSLGGFNRNTFTYEELQAATGGFSQANLLGQGGFGYVFKGYLPNGKEVAVKQLKAGSGQGEREFQAEVEIISRVHHRHLVSLVGYCIAGAQRLLVYEFVPNNTLEHHLHAKGQPPLDWPTRVKIAVGSSKGFAYLHEDCHPKIIHRDIKASNILLDYKFEAMVADFGLAKLSSDNYTHVSTRIMGTFGYLAPEYASSGKLTDKSDVFSFGVMLLELITGRKPIDHTCMDDSLVDWARPILTEALAEGKFDELADPRLEGKYNTLEMATMVSCAAASVRHSARRRPKMSQVVRALEGDSSLDDLNDGMKPGQSMHFNSSSEHEMTTSYSAKMRQFRKMALGTTTDEYSGNYTGVTSEYGLNPSESSSSSGECTDGVRKHHPQL